MRDVYKRALSAGLGLAFWASLCAPAAAIDAQRLFQETKDSVVVVIAFDKNGKPGKFGSGFYIKQGDLVATNYHVVETSTDIKLKLGDGSLLKVEEVKYIDKESDLAVLRVGKPGKALPLQLVDPKIGEDILAIGNPGGLEHTISTGIVSGIRHKGKIKVYQITAPISPGSSGGPILNEQGHVVGLATFYMQGGQNLNFAVPARYVEDILSGSIGTSGPGEAPSAGSKAKLEIEKEKDGSISIKKKN